MVGWKKKKLVEKVRAMKIEFCLCKGDGGVREGNGSRVVIFKMEKSGWVSVVMREPGE